MLLVNMQYWKVLKEVYILLTSNKEGCEDETHPLLGSAELA